MLFIKSINRTQSKPNKPNSIYNLSIPKIHTAMAKRGEDPVYPYIQYLYYRIYIQCAKAKVSSLHEFEHWKGVIYRVCVLLFETLLFGCHGTFRS